jgi:excisionase family DNA binding protein
MDTYIVLFRKRRCKRGTASERRAMQTEIEPEWITYEEAKHLTSLGRTTLWRICTSGLVKTARVGRAVRINRKSLKDYMERHATQLTTPSFDDAKW